VFERRSSAAKKEDEKARRAMSPTVSAGALDGLGGTGRSSRPSMGTIDAGAGGELVWLGVRAMTGLMPAGRIRR
jgi:hypothetical protein